MEVLSLWQKIIIKTKTKIRKIKIRMKTTIKTRTIITKTVDSYDMENPAHCAGFSLNRNTCLHLQIKNFKHFFTTFAKQSG